MSPTRDIGISDSSNGAKEGPYFESHTVVSAKRLKTVNGHALAYLKCGPSSQVPVAVSAVMVEHPQGQRGRCRRLQLPDQCALARLQELVEQQ